MTIAAKYQEISRRVEDAASRSGRDGSSVEVVAVSKRHSLDSIRQAHAAGLHCFGENRAIELRDKANVIPGVCSGGEVYWHMIGHLQTNKVKDIASTVDVVHSLDRLSLAKEIDKRATPLNRKVDCFVQVNISNEDQKYGIDPQSLEVFLDGIAPFSRVNVIGLMGMAAFSEDADLIRNQFSTLRKLRDSVCPELLYLSMGMSNDFEIAIEEGATHVRIGTAIFGDQPIPSTS